jgi:hypothetical protein
MTKGYVGEALLHRRCIIGFIKNTPSHFAPTIVAHPTTMSDDTITTEPSALPRISSLNNLKVSTVFKQSDLSSSPKSSSPIAMMGQSSPPISLRRLMATGSPLKAARSAYSIDFDRYKQRSEAKLASSDQPSAFDLYGYGYGYGADEERSSTQQQDDSEGTKRRRYQRRNSKTPAMLMAMNSPLLFHLDFLEDKKEHENSSQQSTPSASNEQSSSCKTTRSPRLEPRPLPNFDSWDGGLEIAEDLVMHLQKRKRSTKP